MSSCYDDDDCQFIERSNILGKAVLVAHTRAVSLPDDKQRKTQTEKKKRRDDDAITGLKTSEPRVSGEKRKKSPILSTPEGGHSIIWGQELQKALKPNCFFKYGFIHTWNRKTRLGR